jgi:hypothetical protein
MARCSCLEAADVSPRFARCRSLRINGVSENEEGVRGGVLDLRKGHASASSLTGLAYLV